MTDKKEPPEEVQEEFEQIRPDCVHALVARSGIFPPEMLSLKHGSEQRFHVLTTVLRYRIAHRAVTGLNSFKTPRGKRMVSYKWAAWETGTEYKQINEFINTVYSPFDDPQSKFGGDMMKFVNLYEQREALC